MKRYAHHLWELFQRNDPRIVTGLSIGIVLLLVAIWWIVRSYRPTPEEIERRRRETIALTGRITDGYLVDARSFDGEESVSPTPDILFYSYRLAGVSYNCAQDVSRLGERVLGYRIDKPIQIRYDPRNPGNSILVSESWSGLWVGRNVVNPQTVANLSNETK